MVSGRSLMYRVETIFCRHKAARRTEQSAASKWGEIKSGGVVVLSWWFYSCSWETRLFPGQRTWA
jgi:hypothetical protein